MTEVERAAEQSVARGVGFGALAVALVVAGSPATRSWRCAPARRWRC